MCVSWTLVLRSINLSLYSELCLVDSYWCTLNLSLCSAHTSSLRVGCLPPISVYKIFLDLYRSLENGNSSSEVMETGFLRQPLVFGNTVESVILIVNISKTTIEVTLSVLTSWVAHNNLKETSE